MIEEEHGADASSPDDYVAFRSAGEAVKGEFRCAACGYGVAIVKTLPACPMCGGEVWEESAWSPFGRATGRLQ